MNIPLLIVKLYIISFLEVFIASISFCILFGITGLTWLILHGSVLYNLQARRTDGINPYGEIKITSL